MTAPWTDGVLDELDDTLVRLLEDDGRQSHRDLAAAVGLSRSAVAARVQRLLGEGHIAVRGVVHPAVLGRASLAHVSLRVRGPALPVAEAVAARPDTAFVSVVAGHHSVVVELRAADPGAIDRALAGLRATPGVDGLDTVLYTEVLRDVAGPVGELTAAPDAVDLALLRVLQRDGRASYVALGEAVGLSAPGARRRVLRLLEGRAVRVGAVLRHSGRDLRSALGIGLRLGPGPDPLPEVATLPQLTFAARSVGRYDAVLTANATTTGQLAGLLDTLRALLGVREVESWAHLEFVKETYAAALPQPPG